MRTSNAEDGRTTRPDKTQHDTSMSADHAHDAGHGAPTHDLEKKRTRASSEVHGEGHDEAPPPLPSLAMGIALTAVCTTAMTVNVRSLDS